MTALTEKFGETAVKRALLLGVIGAILTGFMVVNTITAENLGSGAITIGNATFGVDADTSVTATGVVVNTAGAAADTSEEATIGPFAALNNALTTGDYAYKFDVFESGVATWATSTTYTIDVYETTGGVTASLGTYNTLQSTPDPGNVEGLTVTVNLGSVVPDEFDIIVTKD